MDLDHLHYGFAQCYSFCDVNCPLWLSGHSVTVIVDCLNHTFPFSLLSAVSCNSFYISRTNESFISEKNLL